MAVTRSHKNTQQVQDESEMEESGSSSDSMLPEDPMDTEAPSEDASSPLLNLAVELRNLIWEFTLTAPSRLAITDTMLPQQPALTRTCRRIRTESLPVFYKKNDFRYYCTDFSLVALKQWVERIGVDNFKLTNTHSRYVQTGNRENCVANLLSWLQMSYQVGHRGQKPSTSKSRAGRSTSPFYVFRDKIFGLCKLLKDNKMPWDKAEAALLMAIEIHEVGKPDWYKG